MTGYLDAKPRRGFRRRDTLEVLDINDAVIPDKYMRNVEQHEPEAAGMATVALYGRFPWVPRLANCGWLGRATVGPLLVRRNPYHVIGIDKHVYIAFTDPFKPAQFMDLEPGTYKLIVTIFKGTFDVELPADRVFHVFLRPDYSYWSFPTPWTRRHHCVYLGFLDSEVSDTG